LTLSLNLNYQVSWFRELDNYKVHPPVRHKTSINRLFIIFLLFW
jgi:hypothetical protein